MIPIIDVVKTSDESCVVKTSNEPCVAIEWIFEKIFESYYDSSSLYQIPFRIIKERTFMNPFIHETIRSVTIKSLSDISGYLANESYHERFIRKLVKDINETEIFLILDRENPRFNEITTRTLHICLLNRFEYFDTLIKSYPGKLTTDLLMYVAEHSLEEEYFYLRKKNLYPNLSILRRATSGKSVSIVKDCLEYIAPVSEIIELAFQHNNTEIIKLFINENRDDSKISNNLIAYALANNNRELIEYMDDRIVWHMELYYSALLSGSMEMIRLVESKMTDIHNEHKLDTSRIKKGRKHSLLNDIMYHNNNKTYFAHTMNYAVQSGSLEVVKYIASLGYGIALTNIISAITKGCTDILSYLLSHSDVRIPFYLIHYVGVTGYTCNKMEMIKCLCESTNILDDEPNNVEDYKIERLHLDMINSRDQINENMIDIDYLMKHIIFFNLRNPTDYRILNKSIALIRLHKNDTLYTFIRKNSDHVQLICDAVYLFGDLIQVKLLRSIIVDIVPNIRVISELFCRYSIVKLLTLRLINIVDKYEYSDRIALSKLIIELNDNMIKNLYNMIFEQKFD